jgi:hypothetical protein
MQTGVYSKRINLIGETDYIDFKGERNGTELRKNSHQSKGTKGLVKIKGCTKWAVRWNHTFAICR